MPITKTELTRLVRVARSFGHYAGAERGTWDFTCPVHREALNRVGERISAHKFPVHHLPWEHTPTVALVTKALRSHLEDAEINDEPCSDLSVATR